MLASPERLARAVAIVALTALASSGEAGAVVVGRTAMRSWPRVDAHVHVLSPAGAARMRARLAEEAPEDVPRGAAELLAMLDSAGVQRGLVISDAYEFGEPALEGRGEEAVVRAENDWAAAQAARAPGRLVAFCSVDPLRDYALREVARCASRLRVRGIKLHLSSSGVDLRREADVERLRAIFAAADARGLAILVHLRTMRADYGAPDARVFIERVLSAAPHVPVQVAHLGGWGGYDAATDTVLGVFARALAAGTLPEGGRNLYFDVAFVAAPVGQPQPGPELLRRLHQIGTAHLVFGSDWPLNTTTEAAAELRAALASDPALAAAIFANVPPYLRSDRLAGLSRASPPVARAAAQGR